MARLLRTKKAKDHRKRVQKWRAEYQAKGLTYKKVKGKWKWVPKIKK